ncbi:MAG: alpha-1,2-fucosyltransferase, partial [Candidatus Pacebacteria bacterium]|nr:alpha-1,2-fucosyltransferase [Candidatus Paceibacterota bacterium]
EWVKGNMPLPYPAIYVSSPDIPDYEELILMSQCRHHIIANSSFSWWGAWLNPHTDKIVVAPKQWVQVGNSKMKDVVPDGWVKILKYIRSPDYDNTSRIYGSTILAPFRPFAALSRRFLSTKRYSA